jgi:pilus assembly protein Flp/PilA
VAGACSIGRLRKILTFVLAFKYRIGSTIQGIQERGKSMIKTMKLFWIDDNGATAIEYGLIAAGIAVAIIAIIPTIGGKLVTTFTKVSGALN